MKWTCSLALALAFAFSACDDSASGTTTNGGQQEGRLGELSLHLHGVDSAGTLYRLRAATFAVDQYVYWDPYSYDAGAQNDAGQFSATLSTEDDVNATALSLRVVEGSYIVRLLDSDWYLERSSPSGGWTGVEQAVLLSPSVQYSYVSAGVATTVAYRFGVDGQLIDFRGGELRIGIEIERPGEYPDAGFPWPDAAAPDAGSPWLPDTGVTVDANFDDGGSIGKACGARAGDTCGPSEYCAYRPGQNCGAADAEATCQGRFSVVDCVTEPQGVCGCDGNTYATWCGAGQAGTGINYAGACK